MVAGAMAQESAGGRAIKPSMRQEISLQLQARIAQEQIPILTQRLEQRPELQGIFLIQNARRVARMPEKKALEYVEEVKKNLGSHTAKELLIYALAGKVREVHPEFNWKRSRKVAKALLNRIASRS